MYFRELNQAFEASIGSAMDPDFTGYMNRRYAEFRDDRINALSFLYDLYTIRRRQTNAIGQFSDFPMFKYEEKNRVMVDFARMMQKKSITAEDLTSDLVTLCRSNRIKTSSLMLKVIQIMEDDIYNLAGSQLGGQMHRGDANNMDNRTRDPYARVFEVIDYIDDDHRGNIMDFTLVTYLNSFLKFHVRVLLDELIKMMKSRNHDLRSLISECIDAQDIVDYGKLYDLLSRNPNITPQGIDQLFDKMRVTKTTKLPIEKLQIKLEREIVMLKVLEDVDDIKEVIYGQDGPKIDAEELGVANAIDTINKSLANSKKTFSQAFYSANNKIIEKIDFERSLTTLHVSVGVERQRILEICRIKKAPNTFSVKTLKSLCDSRSITVDGTGKSSKQQLNATIQNIKRIIGTMGVNLATLFTRMDTNVTNSLDQRVSCCLTIGIILPAVSD